MRSIVADLWDEWSSYPAEDEETSSQETAGLIAGLRFKEGRTASGGSARLWVLHRLLKLWKTSRWARELNLAAGVRIPSDMKGRVRLDLPLSLYKEITAVTGRETWDWVRGAWGSCGALYAPRAGYYLVMRTSGESARRLAQILRRARVSHSSRAGRGAQKQGEAAQELILRNQQSIVTFLSKLGLTGISLSMEEKAVLRAVRSQANRESNCDTANIRKSLKTAEEQMELALSLQRNGLIESLPERLRELVELRLQHPDATLSDLGQLLSPPVTKSTVKYRWNRISEPYNESR
jgi:DNA-binding protein WhiA